MSARQPLQILRHPILLQLGADGALPTEFRLFQRGPNETRRGSVLFDAAAADAVMAAFHAHGVDLMIDLEHLSVAPEEVSGDGRNFDPDARGYCKLALRDGELWAVDVTWTPDGAARLKDRRQRYVSPAIAVDSDRRVIAIFNIALTAQPATDHAPALVATDRTQGRKTNIMDPKLKLVALLKSGMSVPQGLAALGLNFRLRKIQILSEGGGSVATIADICAQCAEVCAKCEEACRSGTADEAIAAVTECMACCQQCMDACSKLIPAGAPAAGDETMKKTFEDEPGSGAMMRQVFALSGEGDPNAAIQVLAGWKRAAVEHEANVAKLAADRKVLEDGERRSLVAQLVKLGRETPGTAWADDAATKPRGMLASVPLEELRGRVKAFGGAPVVGAPGVTAPARGGITAGDGIEISAFELARVKHALSTAKRIEGTQITEEDAVARYEQIKRQQIAGAVGMGKTMLARMVSRPLTEADVICTETGGLRHGNLVMLSTPVKPVEEFGATSQRAVEEFRLEYMTKLASQPTTWAEELGSVIPGGLKDTYPIDFAVSIYKKKVAQTAPARTANVKEVQIIKDLYHEAEECELFRLQQGDFAYVRSWLDKAARMARARVFLRNQLVSTLLEANAAWVDGVAFFATTHKVDPFDASRTFRGSATWSNLQDGAAAPLSAAALTAEKNLFLYSTPGPDGNECGHEVDVMLYPTILNEIAKNLITLQDLIANVAGTATERNPHYGSGLGLTRAPELAGTATTANWYLGSRAGFASGMVPWIISEDPTEEVRQWDETSDFYKDSGFVKYESLVRVAAGLLYPHCLRKILGT